MGFRLNLFSIIMLLSLAGVANVNVIEERRPSFSEVEVLVAKKRFVEAMRELPKVSHSERGAKWDALVGKASAGYISDLDAQGESQSVEISNQLLKQYPQLARSDIYQNVRNDLIVGGFKNCFANEKDRTHCRRRIKLVLQSEPENVKLIQQVGAVVAKDYPTSLLDIYAGVMNFGNRDELCSSPAFQDAIWGQIASRDVSVSRLAQGLLEKECWAAMAETGGERVQRELASTSKRNIVCRMAKKKKDKGILGTCQGQP